MEFENIKKEDKIKQTLAIKLGAAFITVMIFFTLFSRTIFYFLTPKVSISRPASGTIRTSYSFFNVEFEYKDVKTVNIPHRLSRPLNVDYIHVKVGEKIKKGDNLISFDMSAYEAEAMSFRRDIEFQEIQLMEFEKAYKDRVFELRSQIRDLDLRLSEDIQDTVLKNSIKDNKSKLEGDLKYLQDTGILYGNTKSSINNRLKELKSELSKIEKLIVDYSKIKSQAPGIVTGIYISENEMYEGRRALLEIVPDMSKRSLMVELSSAESEALEVGIPCKINYKLSSGEKEDNSISDINNDNGSMAIGRIREFKKVQGGAERANWAMETDLNHSQEKTYAVIYIDDGEELPAEAKNINVVIDVDSEYYETIIPNSAFISKDTIYVVKRRKGFFGEELYVVETKVKTGQGDARETGVTSGLLKREEVVTNWDRALSHGKRVMLPLE